jgi:hypothetical protein
MNNKQLTILKQNLARYGTIKIKQLQREFDKKIEEAQQYYHHAIYLETFNNNEIQGYAEDLLKEMIAFGDYKENIELIKETFKINYEDKKNE